jgi:hypothetical protein
MNTQELLEKFEKAFDSENPGELKDLADACAEVVLRGEGDEFVLVSVVCYSVAKFCDKRYVIESSEWKAFKEKAIEQTLRAKKVCAARKGKEDSIECRELLSSIITEMQALSRKFGKFVIGVVEKSRIKTGAQLYGHGASLGVASELAGVHKSDLAKYVGATLMPDKYFAKPLQERIADARKILS